VSFREMDWHPNAFIQTLLTISCNEVRSAWVITGIAGNTISSTDFLSRHFFPSLFGADSLQNMHKQS